MTYYIPESKCVVYGIKTMHAERIYSGEKDFELRKIIPKTKPDIIFLYEHNGAKAITGGFYVTKIITLPINELWKTVGERGASEERFNNYFKNRKKGNAIEIGDYIKFSTPITFEIIRELEPKFRHPQSFLYLDNFPKLKKLLFDRINLDSFKNKLSIELVQPDESDFESFKNVVLKEISKKYDEIDKSFVSQIIRCTKEDVDRKGFLTTKKNLFTITNNGQKIGFTVITQKRGLSFKTGPTILNKSFRNIGLGVEVRKVIAQKYFNLGFRRMYCTCNSQDSATVNYLLKSGMRIEAHLLNHYKRNSSEFVFSKILLPAIADKTTYKRKKIRIREVSIFGSKNKPLKEFILLNFPKYYLPIEADFVDKLFVATKYKKNQYENKGKTIFYASNDEDVICAVVICTMKRGGAVRLNPLVETSDKDSIELLFNAIFNYFKENNRRKLYMTIPANDMDMIKILNVNGYVIEGLLIEPYRKGLNLIHLGKMIGAI